MTFVFIYKLDFWDLIGVSLDPQVKLGISDTFQRLTSANPLTYSTEAL